MLSYCTNYAATMPDIIVHVNCDTQIAINVNLLGLNDYDDLIFIIKNYDYVDSPYVFLFRTRKSDADENGEVFFKIPPKKSKYIKPDAFYNLSLLVNAHNPAGVVEYIKLTDNGKIILEYGAHDLTSSSNEEVEDISSEIISVRLEPVEDTD